MSLAPLLAFDMGNVLLPFDHMRACAAVAAQCGRSADFVYQQIFRSGLESRFEAGELEAAEFTYLFSQSVGARFSEAELAPLWSNIFVDDKTMDHLVSRLALRYDLCLVSNTNQWHFAHVQRTHAIVSRFKNRVLSYEVKCLKPNRAIYAAALSFCRAGQSAVFIDDVSENVAAAADCGMEPIHFTSASSLMQDLRALGIVLD